LPRVQQHVDADQTVKKLPLVIRHRKHYTAVYRILP
jgi:hypothetical protein